MLDMTADPQRMGQVAKEVLSLAPLVEKEFELGAENQIQRTLDRTLLDKHDNKIYRHKLLECFNTDDLFISLSDAVASELAASILKELPKP